MSVCTEHGCSDHVERFLHTYRAKDLTRSGEVLGSRKVKLLIGQLGCTDSRLKQRCTCGGGLVHTAMVKGERTAKFHMHIYQLR